MRRILVLLTVVAMMVVMLAMSVTPAFAGWNPATGCRDDREGGGYLVSESFPTASPGIDGKLTEDDLICMHRRIGNEDFYVFRFYDNRPPEV
jgi:hypothetical protein